MERKIAFVFSGQGAQYTGMGKDIAQKYANAMEIYNQASDELGYDVAKMCFEGPDEDLMLTENTQPAILTTSIAIYNVMLSHGLIPEAVAGLSLGEYSALVAANCFSFKDAVKLVRKRGRFMQEAVPVGKGKMAAIMGLERSEVIQACSDASVYGVVEPANFNYPGQIVISGESSAIEKACEICQEAGAKRTVILPVSAPFHCSMLKGAGILLSKELENIDVSDIVIPVISNVTADFAMKDDVKQLLVRQVSSPVLWEDCINKLIESGFNTFVEIGPGKTLTVFIKKINKELTVLNVENISTLEKALKELGGDFLQ